MDTSMYRMYFHNHLVDLFNYVHIAVIAYVLYPCQAS